MNESKHGISRFFYSLECPDINELRSLSISNRWLETDFTLEDDYQYIKCLTEEELSFYKFIFTFLSAADDLVNVNIGSLITLFKQKDIHHYYLEQECIEVVHSRIYSQIQLMLFEGDIFERLRYTEATIQDAYIKAKVDWLEYNVQMNPLIGEKYILMIIIEGIFFTSSFAAISYFRNNGLFVVMCQLNDLISRDEAVHTSASCCIYNNYISYKEKPAIPRIHQLFMEAVNIECNFISAYAPKNQRIINIDAILQYVRYNADRLLSAINIPVLFNAPAPKADFPLAFMTAEKHTNFFERHSTAYTGAVINDL
ncbi:ribonucleotide reductase, small subunit [Cercopithecine alphaherpesvirus 9]|uniref:ribonucleoside-diphosphate reductase n=1 Tax=Cercopithecine herpesvirus 9 (strain DHV) TaxID=36348 RepID=Q9E1Z7_CHV9D|nr:ribonucleotide reductase subunit 2 [Cercopithecine alphaherpesvirus 9]AAG27191.1 ribonucleotide reductase, small subunit [Cercopithecine alphaherpesvirus 9]